MICRKKTLFHLFSMFTIAVVALSSVVCILPMTSPGA
jgi:hypothetical protein